MPAKRGKVYERSEFPELSPEEPLQEKSINVVSINKIADLKPFIIVKSLLLIIYEK